LSGEVDSGARRLPTFARVVLLTASVLVALVGVSLFFLSTHTDQFFAWTVRPPLTAAFMGAGYLSSVVLEALAARERIWASARLALVSSFAFSVVMLAATLLHIDRFHFQSTLFPTGIGTWAWLLVYVLYPPIAVVALVRQSRLPGADSQRDCPLAPWLRWLLALQAVVLLGSGLGLFLTPGLAGRLWPWNLTPLTARATAAWLIGLGVAAAEACWENDRGRVRPGAAGYLVFGLLEFVVLARYPASLVWGDLRTWAYIVGLLSIVFVAACILLPVRPAHSYWQRLVSPR
jgi:hypothetical protein